MVNYNIVMYIFVNKGLGMSSGKMAAQVGHAVGLAQRGSKKEIVDKWYDEGSYTKLIMEAADAKEINEIEEYLNLQGIKSFKIVDEGRTEIPSGSITALGIEIIDKEIAGHHFRKFKLYKSDIIKCGF